MLDLRGGSDGRNDVAATGAGVVVGGVAEPYISCWGPEDCLCWRDDIGRDTGGASGGDCAEGGSLSRLRTGCGPGCCKG
jgi:hypothetical protein